jgi:hypothetical protein
LLKEDSHSKSTGDVIKQSVSECICISTKVPIDNTMIDSDDHIQKADSAASSMQDKATLSIDCTDTDAVLDTIDSVVAYAEGIDMQHAYEQKKAEEALRSELHGLTDKEAALVRLQMMENNTKPEDSTAFTFPEINIDDLNICGTELADEKPSLIPSDGTTPSVTFIEAEHPPDCTSKQHCAICFDEAETVSSPKKSSVTFAYLPCCGADGKEESSTTKICTSCILLLSNPTSDADTRIGRCPRCRSWIAVSTVDMPRLSITPVTNAGQCQICNQTKEHLVENAAVCDACFLGRRRPLIYECKECQGRQTIPHPMYRYQLAIDEFGSTSWACQGRCQNFTMWRILPDQVRYVFMHRLNDFLCCGINFYYAVF